MVLITATVRGLDCLH